VYGLAVDPDDHDRVLAATADGLLGSRDGGATWEPTALHGVPVTAIVVASDDGNVLLAYGARADLGLLRSDDGGATWTPAGLVLEEGDAVSQIAIDPSRPERLHVGTFTTAVLRSEDHGATWARLSSRSGRR